MELNRNDGHKRTMRDFIQPNIGLDSDTRYSIIEILNKTLANEGVLTLKTRSAHWNGSGRDSFELHILFDAQYGQLNEISGEIAERVRMLGGVPISSFQEFIKFTQLDENTRDLSELMNLLVDHEATIRHLREDVKKCSDLYQDKVTGEFLVKTLYQHEKMAWMLRSHIEPEIASDEIR